MDMGWRRSDDKPLMRSAGENLFFVFQILSNWNCRNGNSGDN
jgi:hypothetical protein